jgi:hypothetical protein
MAHTSIVLSCQPVPTMNCADTSPLVIPHMLNQSLAPLFVYHILFAQMDISHSFHCLTAEQLNSSKIELTHYFLLEGFFYSLCSQELITISVFS